MHEDEKRPDIENDPNSMIYEDPETYKKRLEERRRANDEASKTIEYGQDPVLNKVKGPGYQEASQQMRSESPSTDRLQQAKDRFYSDENKMSWLTEIGKTKEDVEAMSSEDFMAMMQKYQSKS